eukprot:3999465-Pleurochrysis_carterae.AAC.1
MYVVGAAAVYDEPNVTIRVGHASHVPFVKARVTRRKKRAGVRMVLTTPECVIVLWRRSRGFLDYGVLMLAVAGSGDGDARDGRRRRPSSCGFAALDVANARAYAGAVANA